MSGKIVHAYEESLARAKSIGELGEARKDILNIAVATTYQERIKQICEAVKRQLD